MVQDDTQVASPPATDRFEDTVCHEDRWWTRVERDVLSGAGIMNMRAWMMVGMALVGAAACGVPTTKPMPEESFTDLADLDEKSDAFSWRMRVAGTIKDGETKTTRYTASPRFRALRLSGTAGDRVDAWVRARNDDAVAWLTDGRYNVLASNDDADGTTLDAHLVTTLKTTGTHYIIFRTYDVVPATFDVSLDVQSAQPDYRACTADSECIKVSMGGCCTAWQKTAVNATYADAYAADNQCKPPYPPCAPPPDVEDRRVAVCEAGRCALVDGCDYGGAIYRAGATFTAVDGCNTCSCGADGLVACTKKLCFACVYNGVGYPVGASFPSTDGCNTCSCTSRGNVVCTTRACPL
jgi:hypothetical protein